MPRLLALLLLWLAFALLHAAVPKRLRVRWVCVRRPAWPMAMRLTSAACAAASLIVWMRIDDVTSAVCGVLGGSAICASVFVPFAGCWPRACWTTVALTPLVIALLLAQGSAS